MKELIQTVRAKSNPVITVFGELSTPLKVLTDRLRNPNGTGWSFLVGDPELWKFSDRLIVPGGRVLDLGAGFGRSSTFFALHGMQVTCYEIDPDAVQALRQTAEAFSLPLEVTAENLIGAELGIERFDTVLLGQTFVHFSSKKPAIDVLQRAIKAIKPGGHLWLRAGTKLDSGFEELTGYAKTFPNEVRRVNSDVYMAPCSCSGERRIEPHLFFNPIELLFLLRQKGLKVIHQQTIPALGKANIMFGESWHGVDPDREVGMITILAQK